MRVHVLGASGAGSTTLGRSVAQKLDIAFFDSDDFYWLSSDPPYTQKRSVPERVALLEQCLDQHPGWVLSGSIVGWSEPGSPLLRHLITHIVFVSLDQEVRLERLRARELQRHGKRVQPGGDMYEQSLEFLAYAARYEDSTMSVRTRVKQEQWLKDFDCPILRVDSLRPLESLVDETLLWLSSNDRESNQN